MSILKIFIPRTDINYSNTKRFRYGFCKFIRVIGTLQTKLNLFRSEPNNLSLDKFSVAGADVCNHHTFN